MQALLLYGSQVLQEQLQRAASFSDTEMLDRRVIRKLMVTYFQKPKASNEVLKLIASMLVSAAVDSDSNNT